MESSTVSPSAYVAINGQRMYVNPSDTRAQQLLRSGGTFNPLSAVIWKRLLAALRWDLIVDVGSNYGEMLLEIAPSNPATVIAFEANPTLIPYLTRTLSDAGRNAKVEPVALSNSEGTVTFNLDETWSGTSSIVAVPETARGHAIRSIEVPATTLDNYFASETARNACVKIDVEGAEQLVLRGGELFFARRENCTVMMEIAHLDAKVIRSICTSWRLYLMSRRTHAFVRVDPDMLAELGSHTWLYPQDAVLVSPRSGLRLAQSDAHRRFSAAQACAFDLSVELSGARPAA
ncbi:FkbM family methyltransferase [Paraburkholderia caballeronis]|uniref:Methyltransferase, FkbM family n=1 Tax=Paraburkholderia caballeronis TaxID=416943 RepID=A0A1H7SPP0_9BURK|nr:FkbM family methyltransferase [Paraburkholderia caballeronis]PXW22417.1 FkbM family methyltransferase [Paraburkholderia caballeronis]PXW96075.1 FkbM family methyltransferase [Paraburkholderia caballeronis]RAJ92441.1 FkbM family methyltransferase [Paraburkholderia caballeronis]SEB49086.1 methyltransferase, FkbM family [Paraburkholderia caballeronis]SEL74438.1 methyltransferase, FkbM family [Paraburkholderia caballeronis]